METKEYITLVDKNDSALGKLEKIETHKLGLLHRAFSIFIFNSKQELLLQQRAEEKYHSAGLWTNTCCGHPRFGEELVSAANRRLFEEMGLKTKLESAFSFIYKAEFENGLTEYEYDHVFWGQTDVPAVKNEEEVKDWKYMNLYELKKDINNNPAQYSEWIKLSLPRLIEHLEGLAIANKNIYNLSQYA
jgi:isopentenyl-diphosphate delta-isomerase